MCYYCMLPIFSIIDTLAEVVSDPTPVTSFGTNFRNKLANSTDPLVQKLLLKYSTHYDFGAAFKNLSFGRAILGESQQNSLYNIRAQFTNL